MTLLLVLVSLIASSAALGYSREGPSAQSGEGGTTTEDTLQPSSGTPSPPPVVPSPTPGYPRYHSPTADTAAVAAARAAHQAALERAKALWFGAGGRDDGSYDPYKHGDAYNYNSLLANVLIGHLGGINTNLIPTYLHNLGNRPYYGPMDVNLGIPKGYIAEAKAAEMAREAQFRALERARINAFLNANFFPYPNIYYPSSFQSAPNATKANTLATILGIYSGLQGPLNRPYFGPLAAPTVLSSGYLADTPEVAASRAAHLATLFRAKALWDAKRAKGALNDQQLYDILHYYNKGSLFGPAGVSKDLESFLQGSFNSLLRRYLENPSLPPAGHSAATAARLSALATAAAEASLSRQHHLYKRSY